MQAYYPEVLEQSDYIAKVVRSEEDRFSETLTDGLNLLNSLIADLKQQGGNQIAGPTPSSSMIRMGSQLNWRKNTPTIKELPLMRLASSRNAKQKIVPVMRGAAKAMGLQHDLLINVKTPSEYVGYTQLYDQ